MPRKIYPRGYNTVGALIMLTMGLAGWFFLRDWYERRLNKPVQEERRIPRWDAKEFGALAIQVVSNYAAVIEALDTHNYLEADKLSEMRAGLDFAPWVEHHASKEYRGLTVSGLYDYLQNQERFAVQRELRWIIDEIRAGRRPRSDLKVLGALAVRLHPEIVDLSLQVKETLESLGPATEPSP